MKVVLTWDVYNNWKTNNACAAGTWSWLFILLVVSYFFKTVNQGTSFKKQMSISAQERYFIYST